MKLKIKEVAKIFNCTTEALRFYEKENVLIPKRDPENNYRYYGVQHLKLLSKCNFFRSVGFSVKEVTDIMDHGTINTIGNELRNRETDLIKEAERLLEISRTLANYRNKIESIPLELNTFNVVNSPEMLLLINQHNDDVFNQSEYLRVTASLLKCFPFINISILVKQHDVLNENHWSRYHGYSINKSSRFYNDFNQEALITTIPSKKCLYTIQSFNLTQDSKMRAIQRIKDFINNNNYIVNGDMIGNQLFVDNEKYLDRKKPAGLIYYEYWIPIE
ncbi:MerR family transcriptional regulator [Shewanella sp. A14]